MSELTPEKRKNRSPLRVIVNAGGCLLAAVMLVIGGLVGVGGALYIAPGVFGFNVTATALAEDGILLAATAADLDQRGRDASASETAFARDQQATEAALNNAEILLEQTATQSARFVNATITADAAANARQRTQIALDATATQAALQRNATQIEIDFRNTQAALDGGNPVQAQSVATDPAPVQQTPLLPASDTPTATPSSSSGNIRYTFGAGILSDWAVRSNADWVVQDGGIRANTSSWIRLSADGVERLSSEIGDAAAQRITWELTPAAVPDATYWLLFGIDETGGYAATIRSETLVAVEINLYRFMDTAWNDGLLNVDEMTRISRALSNSNLVSPTQFAVILDGDTAQVRISDIPVLASDGIPASGRGIGAQLPQGAVLRSVSVTNPAAP